MYPIIFLIAFARGNSTNTIFIPQDKQSYSITGKIQKVIEKAEYKQIYIYDYELIKDDVPYWKDDMSDSNHDKTYYDMSDLPLGLIINYYGKQDVMRGDIILYCGELYQFEKAHNPYNFDMWKYYRSQNIDCYGRANELVIVENNKNVYLILLFHIKELIKQSIERIIPQKEGGVVLSMILGDKSQMEINIKELYQQNGISHILAISGLHISIIGMGLYTIIRKLLIPFAPSFVIAGGFILSYGIITGNSISTIRAITMFLVCIFAQVLGKKYDLISALCLSLIISLFIYPRIMYNNGLYLSYFAVLSIDILVPYMKKMFSCDIRNNNIFLNSFFGSASVCIGTLPIICMSYYEIPTYSILINIIVIPLMSLCLFSAVIGSLAGVINTTLGQFLISSSYYILKLYELICNVAGRLPLSSLIVGKPSILAVVLFYLFIVLSVCLCNIKKKRASIICIVIAFVVLFFRSKCEFNVTFLDVGQGNSIFVQSDNETMLFDCGSMDVKNVAKYRVLPFLKGSSVKKLDCIVVSHCDSDHISGIVEMIESNSFKIEKILLPDISNPTENYDSFLKCADDAGIEVIKISKGDSFFIGGIKVTCLRPDEGYGGYTYEDENEYSTVLNLEYKDKIIMLTGDISSDVEKEMVDGNYLKDVDILQVAHHGSKYSTSEEFLNLIKPEIAIISCGKNNRYGHPHEETLRRLEEIGSEILRTDEYGAIMLSFSPSGEVKKGVYR